MAWNCKEQHLIAYSNGDDVVSRLVVIIAEEMQKVRNSFCAPGSFACLVPHKWTRTGSGIHYLWMYSTPFKAWTERAGLQFLFKDIVLWYILTCHSLCRLPYPFRFFIYSSSGRIRKMKWFTACRPIFVRGAEDWRGRRMKNGCEHRSSWIPRDDSHRKRNRIGVANVEWRCWEWMERHGRTEVD